MTGEQPVRVVCPSHSMVVESGGSRELVLSWPHPGAAGRFSGESSFPQRRLLPGHPIVAPLRLLQMQLLLLVRTPRANRPRRLTASGLVALLLSVAPLPVAAQRSGLAFERMAQERGLSNGTVTAIAQGKTGLLWFGTEDGLNLYDGSGFTLYRPIPGDTMSLADGWVTGLLVTRDGTRWVGTLRGGLNRYLPRTQTFRRYRSIPGDPTSISSDQINAMYEAEVPYREYIGPMQPETEPRPWTRRRTEPSG